jgi:hypothetical protein
VITCRRRAPSIRRVARAQFGADSFASVMHNAGLEEAAIRLYHADIRPGSRKVGNVAPNPPQPVPHGATHAVAEASVPRTTRRRAARFMTPHKQQPPAGCGFRSCQSS